MIPIDLLIPIDPIEVLSSSFSFLLISFLNVWTPFDFLFLLFPVSSRELKYPHGLQKDRATIEQTPAGHAQQGTRASADGSAGASADGAVAPTPLVHRSP